jgi:hypothetical protein
MKTIALSVVLLLGITGLTPLSAQVKDDLKTAGDKTGDAAKVGAKDTVKGAKKVGHAVKTGTKDAAKDTEKGAKTVGHETKKGAVGTEKGVKKGTHKVAKVTAKGAEKVEGKTATPPKP